MLSNRKRRTFSRLLLGLLLALVVGCTVYFKMLSPEARQAKRFLKLMPVDQIQAVVLEPVPYDPKPLSHQTIRVSDRRQITALADLFRTARGWSPNHPSQNWAMVVRFELKDREITGQITSTSNQGVLFYNGLGSEKGWVYGTYRQDALGPLVESIVKEQAGH